MRARSNTKEYHLHRNGESLAVIGHDHGPDAFSEEGLVRVLVDERVGYFGRDFRQAIAIIYVWGRPFENSTAMVCEGCHLDEHNSDGTNPAVGDRWFHIDRHGDERIANP